jgi:2-phosphosulfolactate phosphatase
MRRPVRTLPTAEAAEAADLTGHAVLVLDVLRATTTLAFAFRNGALEAWPVRDIPEALRLTDSMDHARVVLCGEREGRRIPGFDLGNSPAEYTGEAVAGRTLVFASSNGSRALRALGGAARAGIASLVTRSAAARWAARTPEPLTLLCAGNLGEASPEDLIGAGAVVSRLMEWGEEPEMDEHTLMSLELFRAARADLPAALLATPHGSYLASIGFAGDVALAGREDLLDLTPEWDSGRLRPAPDGAPGA